MLTSDIDTSRAEPRGYTEALVALALILWTLSPFVRLLI